MVNKFTRDPHQMTDNTTADETDFPDDFGVRGTAVAYIDPDGEREPAVVKGSVRETDEHARVLPSLEDQEELLDTARENVEVFG